MKHVCSNGCKNHAKEDLNGCHMGDLFDDVLGASSSNYIMVLVYKQRGS